MYSQVILSPEDTWFTPQLSWTFMWEQVAEGGSFVQKNITFVLEICTENNHVINVNNEFDIWYL